MDGGGVTTTNSMDAMHSSPACGVCGCVVDDDEFNADSLGDRPLSQEPMVNSLNHGN